MHLPAAVRPALVGRDREQAELAAALAGARAGHGRAVLLLGEAGMGKSVLADWLARQAGKAGMQVARGACSAAGMPPLWPWSRSLAAIGLELPRQDDGAVAGPAARELMAAAVVEGIAAAAARQPLLIVLEDLHWSDPVSVLVARAAAEAAAALPLMLLLTCRDEQDEATQQVRDRLAELPASVLRMLLPPLDATAVAALADNVAGPGLAGQAAGLLARTGGNPFFVYEVARLIAARGPGAALTVPPGVREVLQRRLARLSQPCMLLLTAAAIVAETAAEAVEDELLCQVSGVSEEAAARLLDEAATERLLDVSQAGPPSYRFRHALVREVLDQGLSSAQRGELHAAVGEALEQWASPPAAAARLAYHWSHAAGPQAREKAVAWSLRAARDAVAGFGFEAAAAHYARALADRSAEAIGVSVEYGEALQLCGDVAAAREVLLGAAREAASAGRAGDLARAALALGGGLAGFEVPLQDEEQADLLREADAALPPEETALRAAVCGRLSLALAGSAPEADRVALAQKAVRLARAAGDRQIESAVLAAYCDAIAGPDYVHERTAAATRMLSLASGTPEASLQWQATVLLARRLLLVALLEQGDLSGAEEQAAAYQRLARRLGIPRYGWLPEIWRAMRALLDGNPDGALEHAEAAEDVGRRAQSFNAELMVFTARMQAHLDRGPHGVSAPSALNRPAFVNSLVADWLPQLPGVLARLQDEPDPARVADLACGTGWAAIELAKAFPHIRVDGLDNDEASVAIGRQHAADHGVADRVDLEVADLADESADWPPRYDLVLLIECVHDFPRPVEVLRHARAAVRPGGTVLVVDERVAESFTMPGDETERFFAAASAIWCLPQGRVGPDPEPVGTLIRPAVMRDLARRAGYADVQILPIEHPAWRFDRLVP